MVRAKLNLPIIFTMEGKLRHFHWHRRRCSGLGHRRMQRKNEKSHLEVSSIATYLSRLRPFLEKIELNEGWKTWTVRNGKRGVDSFWGFHWRLPEASLVHFRHFARFGEREAVSQYPMTSLGSSRRRKNWPAATTLPAPMSQPGRLKLSSRP
jgi:hypothetical protein